jgi:branched-chain amino acid transport system ATP-binding protein
MPLLEVNDLRAGYGDMEVLRGVSFAVEPGQLVSIVGSNSSGKTTLINTLSGLIRPRHGTLVFDGRNIAGDSPHAIVRGGLVQVPEARELFADMSVRDNLLTAALSRPIREGREERIAELLDIFPQLREKLAATARTLSGGQQQMLAILRALMCRPRLLMLDEPSFGLAPFLVREMLNAIERLNRSGVAILLAEQNIRQSLSICDVGFVLEGGRIVAQGPGRSLLLDKRIVESYLGAGI